jgi:hypothetical protein
MTLKAWYPLDTDYLDYSGNRFHGTNSGTSLVTGKIDNGADFEESTNTRITISELTMSGTAFSFACWMKAESSDDAYGRICDSNGSEFNLFANNGWSNGISTNQFFGASAFNLKTIDLSSGWHHIVVTADLSTSSNNVKIYIDGSLSNTLSKSLNSTYSITSMTLGDDSGSTDHFDGILDEVMFFDHVLDTNEITALYSGTYYVVDNYVLKSEVVDGFINQTALFRLRRCNMVLSDGASNTLVNRLAVGDSLSVIDNFKVQFRGIIDDYYYKENKQIELNAYDESFILAEEFVSTYQAGSTDTASDIVSSLIDSFGQGLFTKNITATTRTYPSKTWRAKSPLEIIQEIAFNEDYLFFVSPQRVFNFVPTNSNDLAETVEVGKEIFTFNFPVDNTKMKNFIVVIGKGATDTAGVKEIVRDADSISKYGKRVLRIEDTSITTTDQAVERAEAELARLSNPLIVGKIEVARDYDKTAGAIIGITNSQEGWVNKKFLIVEATHELDLPVSHLQLAEVDIQNSDQIADILMNQRIMSKNFEDDNTPITFSEIVVENITVTMELYVEKETNVVRNWNEPTWNSVDWNATLGNTWTTLINGDDTMVITNNGLNRIRDLVQGESVTKLDSSNTFIAVGTGTGGASLTDTTLGTETDRNAMDSAFPRDGTGNGVMEHQASFDDTDFTSATISEVGLFDASTSGTLIARIVPSVSITKSADEVVRIRTRLQFSQ